MAKTIEELAKIEEENQKAIEQRKNWLRDFDWFIVCPGKLFSDQSNKVIFRLSDLKDELESYDKEHYKGQFELVYRTNRWAENLPELD